MKERRVLVIGDLHEPFTLQGYRAFCKHMYKEYKCNMVIFIGDIIDNNYSSFHETDPDGHGGAQELEKAKDHIKQWYSDFPNALVTLGNHDRIPNRKAFTAGLSKQWVRTIGEVLETPNWTYRVSFDIDGVHYTHGEGRIAQGRMTHDITSVVQGHYHTDSKILFHDGKEIRLWAMQVGCGFNRASYAGQYAKNNKSQSYNVGLVLRDGKLPIIEPYDII